MGVSIGVDEPRRFRVDCPNGSLPANAGQFKESDARRRYESPQHTMLAGMCCGVFFGLPYAVQGGQNRRQHELQLEEERRVRAHL